MFEQGFFFKFKSGKLSQGETIELKKAISPFFEASGNKNIGAAIRIGREIWCLPYAEFFLLFFGFISQKGAKRQQVRIFCPILSYGVFIWIRSQILPHFDVVKFVIGPLKAERK